MSVSDGQTANAATFNAGFVSKNTDDTKAGKLAMSDTTSSTDSAHGALTVSGGIGVGENLNAGGNIAATGTMGGSNLSGTNTGDVTLAAVGSAPAAQGASLSGQVLTLQPADATHPGVVTTGAQTIAGDKTFSGNMVVQGTLEVQGTTTTVNSTELDVKDINITLNHGGTDASAEGSGLSIEGTAAAILATIEYDSTLTSKFKVGASGSESEVITASTAQTMTGVKSFDTGPAIKEITTPTTPATGYQKIYPKADGKFYHLDDGGIETELGSGAGGGSGINFLTGDDFDFESTVGNWVAYGDAAGTDPVDGTGGTPTVTMTRTTSSPLHDTGSGLITKDAVNRQGEGVSIDASRPLGYRESGIRATGVFRVQSGTYAAGDLSIWGYDVTNSQLYSPSNLGGESRYSINTSAGKFDCWFPSIPSTCTSFRLIFHISGTSASAWTVAIDDVQINPDSGVYGVPATDWQEYSLTIGGTTTAPTKGTIVRDSVKWRRVGDSIEIRYDYEQSAAGSAGSGTYLFPLPSGLTVDTSKIAVSTDNEVIVGHGIISNGGDGLGTNSSYVTTVVPYNSTNLAINIQYQKTTGLNDWEFIQLGSSNFSLSTTVILLSFMATIPISNWSSNVTMANSSGFWISNILANGTRVTSTPTKLGEYRSFQKTISATSGTDAAPATSPSSTNGMKLTTVAYGSAGASGEQRYEMFVGKDKKIQWNFFANTGKSGFLDATYVSTSSSTVLGALKGYDPITGIAWVDVMTQTGSTTTRLIGYTGLESGSAPSTPTTGYFDAFISENALAVGVEAPNSEVKLTYASGTGLAFGTLPNKVFYFPTTTTNTGTAFTVTNSAVNGSSITVNESGIYDIQFMYYGSGASNYIGITIDANTTQQNTSLATTDVTTSYVLDVRYDNLTTTEVVPRGVIRLNPGSVIRAQGSTSAGSDYGYLRVVKISN